jgi:hypothetical protein
VLGGQLQQRLVDAAELLGAQVAVVDRTGGAAGAVGDLAEGAHGREQVCVSQLRAADRAEALGGEQGPAERRQADLWAAVVAAEGVEDEPQGDPEVAVAAAVPSGGQPAQAGGREVGVVAPDGRRVGVRCEQHLAILGDEAEQQPVDQPQQHPVVVLAGEAAVGEPSA